MGVGIPDYIYLSSGGSIGGYRLVSGVELRLAWLGLLSGDDKDFIAQQLATFLTSMHSTPRSIARQCGAPDEDFEKDYRDLVRDTAALVFPLLGQHAIRVIGEFRTELAAQMTTGHQTAKVHADLRGEHILWDSENKQATIIDFPDSLIGDPALDFAGLLPCGLEFAIRVIGEFRTELAAQMTTGHQTAKVHADLRGEHILWDSENKQATIIDFPDSLIGDPALDFAGLLPCGLEFAQCVLKQYGGFTDERTLRRAELYFKREALETMVDSLLGYPPTFKEGCEEFGQRFELSIDAQRHRWRERHHAYIALV